MATDNYQLNIPCQTLAPKKSFWLFSLWRQRRVLKALPKLLSSKEAFVIKLSLIVIVVGLIITGRHWYLTHSVLMPQAGGAYIEGLTGTPNLVNPLLAPANEVDQDISRLLFNGLFRQQNNKTVPDLVDTYTVSPDQLKYTLVIKHDITWHDGNPLTASDVAFTIRMIQDPEFKSPLYSSLNKVAVQQPDDYTVILTLPQPFAPFLTLLTFGIIPQHIWEEIPIQTAHLADYNLKNPIGTGPFKFKSLKKDSRGTIKNYTLVRNEEFHGTVPYLDTITFKFYPDFPSAIDALNNKNIDSINYLPIKYHPDVTNRQISFQSLSLPQYSAVFFNSGSNASLADIKIRQALARAINRPMLVKQVLENQGTAIYAPILPGFIGYDPALGQTDFNTAEADKLIIEAGWKKITPTDYQQLLKKVADNKPASTTGTATLPDTATAADQPEETLLGAYWQKNDRVLELTLTTVDNPETALAASLVKSQWETIGVKVNLEIVDKNHLLQDIIKPRRYQALLFGQMIGNDPDPYAFWHSSQATDPGLNLALYNNKQVDSLLEDARKINDPEERAKKYVEFQKILTADRPAIFLYNPTYPYALSQNIKGFSARHIVVPADRFNNIEMWYIKTHRIFKLQTENR